MQPVVIRAEGGASAWTERAWREDMRAGTAVDTHARVVACAMVCHLTGASSTELPEQCRETPARKHTQQALQADLHFHQLKHSCPRRTHILHLARRRTRQRRARMHWGSSGEGAQDLVHHQLQRCDAPAPATFPCPCR